MTAIGASIVECAWLADYLTAPDLRVIDATWYLPTEKKSAREGFLAAHIPGAVFFDIDAIADTKSGLPHMLPTPAAFGAAVGALGIGDGDRVVVYDAHGLYSAARVWWSFGAMGHDNVAVLAGGLPQWRAEGRKLASGEAMPVPRRFTARYRPELVRDRAQVLSSLQRGNAQIVDARSGARFHALEPEPRPGVRGGHIPGAMNLPFAALIDPAKGQLLSHPALRIAFAAAGVDPQAPVTLMCGSGITACVLALALDQLGQRNYAVYDGSWADWGARPELPLAH
jgi:thiosulfate/3-mercaptopyruvate sulfurtransferase